MFDVSDNPHSSCLIFLKNSLMYRLSHELTNSVFPYVINDRERIINITLYN